jgi:hypothetical protein
VFLPRQFHCTSETFNKREPFNLERSMMLYFAAALLLLSPSAKTAPPNPAEYTVMVHVSASHSINVCSTSHTGSDCGLLNHLDVVIDGKKYELEDYDGNGGLLHIGDYHAKLLEGPEANDYQFKRYYEFLFSDGKTHKFRVAGESE